MSPTPEVTAVVVTFTPTPISTPPPGMTPTPFPPPVFTPGVFTGSTRVLKTLADWQALYGSALPPVDFNSRMIIQALLNHAFLPTMNITDVCEGSSQVTVSLTRHVVPHGYATCFAIMMAWDSVAVPQSNLPVVFNVDNEVYF
jgi:hypothetical protein